MILAFLVNDTHSKIIIRRLPDAYAEDIRNGVREGEDIAEEYAKDLHIDCEEWLLAEDSEFTLDSDL